MYNTYLSEDVADPSPLEPGAYLIPANATTVNPPVYNEGFIAVFNGEGWETIEDKRGTYYSLKEGSIFTTYNYNPRVPPEDSTKKVPPEVPADSDLSWDGGWTITQKSPGPELTPGEKLKNAGLTVDELKELLGLL